LAEIDLDLGLNLSLDLAGRDIETPASRSADAAPSLSLPVLVQARRRPVPCPGRALFGAQLHRPVPSAVRIPPPAAGIGSPCLDLVSHQLDLAGAGLLWPDLAAHSLSELVAGRAPWGKPDPDILPCVVCSGT
jgi:hypothetical protein